MLKLGLRFRYLDHNAGQLLLQFDLAGKATVGCNLVGINKQIKLILVRCRQLLEPGLRDVNMARATGASTATLTHNPGNQIVQRSIKYRFTCLHMTDLSTAICQDKHNLDAISRF